MPATSSSAPHAASNSVVLPPQLNLQQTLLEHWRWTKIGCVLFSTCYAIVGGALAAYGSVKRQVEDDMQSREMAVIGLVYGIFAIILSAVSSFGA